MSSPPIQMRMIAHLLDGMQCDEEGTSQMAARHAIDCMENVWMLEDTQ